MSRKELLRFAYETDDLSPGYLHDEASRSVGLPNAEAPPLFLSGAVGWERGPREDDLSADGSGPETEVSLSKASD
jgi:hypothetical protein